MLFEKRKWELLWCHDEITDLNSLVNSSLPGDLSLGMLFNPNKAGLFESSFLWGGGGRVGLTPLPFPLHIPRRNNLMPTTERIDKFQWNFQGKMWLTIVSKITKNPQCFTLSLEDTFLEKPQGMRGQIFPRLIPIRFSCYYLLFSERLLFSHAVYLASPYNFDNQDFV